MLKKVPFILTLLGIVSGIFISILFAINEPLFKNKIAQDLLQNPKVLTMTSQDEKNKYIEKEAEKIWRYYQRFHFHSTGIAAMALGVLILIAFSQGPQKIKLLLSYMVSTSGFLYPFVWLFAALYGPLLGRDAAKEKFALLGYMGGVFMLAVVLVAILLAKYPVKINNENL